VKNAILSVCWPTLIVTLALAGCQPVAGTYEGEGDTSAPAEQSQPAPTTPQPDGTDEKGPAESTSDPSAGPDRPSTQRSTRDAPASAPLKVPS
jgi:hypothetical protein